ncbi:EnvZ/OmpR regulon moderator MzrA [Tatumella saanichensis]|uniref:EnvZ/OmpR regulon moderator MzrA n=1 Tax=Tatumella saanichensis TaxID=480813 RepID=UPI0004BB989E|nr:EnvZ/OmpR regulon moderator MzrA [Tatumella saanichensis]
MQWHHRIARPWLLPAITLILLAAMTSRHLVPDFSRENPVLRIRITQKGASLPDGFYLYQQLTSQGILIKSIIPAADGLVICLEDESQRSQAESILKDILTTDYSTQ